MEADLGAALRAGRLARMAERQAAWLGLGLGLGLGLELGLALTLT